MKFKKSYSFLLTIVLILFSFSTMCNIKQHDFSSENVIENISLLASSTYGGRLPGTKGNSLVGENIRKHFQDNDLSPLNEDYKEFFSVACPTNNYTNAELNIAKDGEILESLVYGKDFKEDMLNFAESSLSFTKSEVNNISESYIEVVKNSKHYIFIVCNDDNLDFRSSFVYNCQYEFAVMISKDSYKKISESLNNNCEISINLPFSNGNADIFNVVGVIKGKSNTLPPLVLSAHFDHLGTDGLGNIYYGALDNASGTSFLLELVSTYSSYAKPDRDIIFVAFNAEEFGLLGSKEFVAKNSSKIEGSEVINFDMIGSKDYPLTFMLGGKATEDTKLLTSLIDICNQNSIKYNKECKDASDHGPFVAKNIDALTVSHSDMSKIHTPNDKVEFIDANAIDSAYKVIEEKISKECYSGIITFFYSSLSLIIFSIILILTLLLGAVLCREKFIKKK